MADIVPVTTHGDGSLFIPKDSTQKQRPKLKKSTSFTVPEKQDKPLDNDDTEERNTDEKKSSASQEMKYEAIEDTSWRFGWICCRPQFLQFLNNPKGYLFFLCVFVFAQGFTVNGLVYVVLSTLERRFNLPSIKTGLMSSSYDIACMCVVGFVTFFGERGHKPLYLSFGALLFSLGSVSFTLPHFLSGPYSYESAEFDLCLSNRTNPDTCSTSDDAANLSRFYGLFIMAQVLHGLGATPIYTLGLTYMDENLPPKQAALYTGIFQATAVFGPALGFLAGGFFLDLYTDFHLDDVIVDISPDSPLWVGAWWLGFLVSASLALLVAVPMMAFPRHLPEYHRAQLKRHRESRKGSEFNIKPKYGAAQLLDIPLAFLNLAKNPTYFFIVSGAICETFIMAFISAFGPKYIESMFSMTSGNAALVIGILVVPAGIIGNLSGGWMIKRFNMTIPNMLKAIVLSLTIGLLGMITFFLSCPNPPFAGVTEGYNSSSPAEGNLTSACNIDCNCEIAYDPVCGSNNVIYYSSCFAGCTIELQPAENGAKRYGDCACIESDLDDEGGIAEEGLCREKCDIMIPWLIVLFLGMTCTFFIAVPSLTCVLRCVDYSQRSFALGMQSLLTKGLGYVPGPIIFGALLDKACLLWEYECDGSSRTCWTYDNARLAYTMIGMAMTLRFLSVLFYTCALCTYRPVEDGAGDGDSETSALFKKSDDSVTISQSSYKAI